MNPYAVSLLCLIVALVGQLAAVRVLVARFFELRGRAGRSLWLALAGGMLILAVDHVFALERLLHTGLYDFRQSIHAALAAILLAYACIRLTRQPA